MSSNSRLVWVQQNRCRKGDRSKTLKALIGEWAEDVTERDWRRTQDIARRIAPYVDQAFRAHCRIASWTGNGLLVFVDQASLVADVKSRWARPLLDCLQHRINGRRVERLLFQYGHTGAEIPSV